MEDLQSRAREIAVAALLTNNPKRAFDELQAALDVTRSDMQQVVQRYLVDNPPVIIVVRPRS
jgi:predicted Zn-dependent peptidase